MQEKYWLGRNPNMMSSFTEAKCGLFDDARLTRAIDSGYLQKYFSEKLCRKVNQLNRLIDQIPDDADHATPEETIGHPKMQELRPLANELLLLFKDELG